VKRPAFQFYPGDWLEEGGLRASCLAARGLWVDMLCFMHQGEPYGHLGYTPEQLARMDTLLCPDVFHKQPCPFPEFPEPAQPQDEQQEGSE